MKFVYLSLLTLLTGSSALVPQDKTLPAEKALEYAKACSNGNNQFACELMNHYLKRDKQKNIFFSPFSISSALSMTGEGAQAQTRKEMINVLHLLGSDSLRKLGFLGINQLLNSPKAAYKLNTSNSLWVGLDEQLKPDFLSAARDYYQASVEAVDFKNADEASKKINLFVENKTEKKIKNLLSPAAIDPLTKLILVNTIYFKANWQNGFKVENTHEKPFTASTGHQVQADMMSQTTHFNYFEDPEVQALEMKYEGDEISMVVILPKTGTSVPAMDPARLSKIMGSRFTNEQVTVSLPKFKFESSYQMKGDLSALGMQTAFTNAADFSGISEFHLLKIAEVIHKAYIEVEEKGTEAAAATAVIMTEITSVSRYDPPKNFNANHPFMFVIRHNASGAILFMGVINDPTT